MLSILGVFAATLAVASSFPTASVQANDARVKRDTPSWISDQGGNIKFTFSDNYIGLGTLNVDKILDAIVSQCGTDGQCQTQDITFGTNAGFQLPATVTVRPGGAYKSWIHNGLLDAFRIAVKKATKCYDFIDQGSCIPGIPNCFVTPTRITHCDVPQYWGVHYEGQGDNDNIFADINSSVSGSGACETLSTVGSAIAGSINGVGGGVFTLLGLFCH